MYNDVTYMYFQKFLDDIPAYEQRFSVLSELGQNLATSSQADDSTSDLQDVLTDINQRWTVVMDRYVLKCTGCLQYICTCNSVTPEIVCATPC